MPEQREPTAIKKQIQHGISAAQESGSDFSTVHAIWCDATSDEAKSFPANSRFRSRLVDKIDASCTFKRGHRGKQSPIFPPQLLPRHTNTPLITSLSLKGPQSISATARALVIDFGPLKLMVSLLAVRQLDVL